MIGAAVCGESQVRVIENIKLAVPPRRYMIIDRDVGTCCTWTEEFVQIGFFVEGVRLCATMQNVADSEDAFFIVVCADEKWCLDKVSGERTRQIFSAVEEESIVDCWYKGRCRCQCGEDGAGVGRMHASVLEALEVAVPQPSWLVMLCHIAALMDSLTGGIIFVVPYSKMQPLAMGSLVQA